jgi:ATP-dependent Clp protease ATP-binding subunit ClpA
MPSLTSSLEHALERSLALAAERGHERATPEHLLLALLSDSDARELLKEANLTSLEAALDRAVGGQPRSDGVELEKVHPTAAFQRVIQRAVLHCESAGRPVVTGADIIVSILPERESDAARLLQAENVSRADTVHNLSSREAQPAGAPETEYVLRRLALFERSLSNALDRIALLEEHVRRLLEK